MEKKLYEIVLKNSVETFKGTYKTGISLILTQAGILIAFVILAISFFMAGRSFIDFPSLSAFVVNPFAYGGFLAFSGALFLLTLIATTFILSLFNYALIYAANCDLYRESLKKAVGKFWGALGLSFLVSCIILPAFLFFVIPGVYLSLALLPVVMVYLYEDTTVWGALSKTYTLTKNKRLDIFILLLFVFGINLVMSMIGGILSAIPLLGILVKVSLDIAFSYFIVVVYRELYWNLKEKEVTDVDYEKKYLTISKVLLAISLCIFLALSVLFSFGILKVLDNPEAVPHFLSEVVFKINTMSVQK